MKVLLVYPNIHGMNMFPTAIALFSAILKERGHTVSLFDSTDYPNPEDPTFNSDKLKEQNLNVRPFDDSALKLSFKNESVEDAFESHVRDFNPDLMMVSTTEDIFPIAIRLLQRTAHMEIPVLMGGVFPTFAPELALSYPEVNMVCVGEGESVLRDLIDRLEKGQSYSDIPGLWIKRKDGSIRKNILKNLSDINANPPLDISIFPESRLYRPMQGKVWRMFPLETHRGCPYRCTYCNSPSQQDKYKDELSVSFFRKKNVSRIRDEIIHFIKNYNAEAFYFWADTFLAYSDPELEEFFEMFLLGKLVYGSWFEHLSGWLRHRDRPNLMIIRYEDLITNRRQSIFEIAQFCEIPFDEERIERVLERSSFAFMKNHQEKFDLGRKMLKNMGIDLNNFIREGKTGGWQEWIDEGIEHRYREHFKRQLSGLDLDDYLPKDAPKT